MFCNYHDALKWIHSRLRLGIKPGLKRMEWMMEKLEHPEQKIKSVHIGGTNGKGSTVTYLRNILQTAGYEVGTFTSPYIEQFNERISLNGRPLQDGEIVLLANVIYPLAVELEDTELGGPTEFEIITAMAFYYFAHIQPVDIVIFEVGLGGRFDSTNIVQPMLSIITNIGLDHTQILGDTYQKIAFEKAGIIKEKTSIITAVKQEDAKSVIIEKAQKEQSPIYILNQDFEIIDHQSIHLGEQFSVNTSFGCIKDLKLSMMGKHQTENATLAVMAAILLEREQGFLLNDNQIRSGLESAYWPGRFEVVSQKPLIILDGAHNDEGIHALTSELKKRYSEKNIHIIFAALSDKKVDKMIKQLDDIATSIAFVDFDYPRAESAELLYQLSTLSNKSNYPDWKSALLQERSQQGKEDILVITGSLYFISQVKQFLSMPVSN
jgi:dihydrofolate synthase / folylpolyglutamate synthase